MVSVKIEKECSCFKRSSYEPIQYFESEVEAYDVATKMAKEMTQEFCKQHGFAVLKEEGNFLIILMS